MFMVGPDALVGAVVAAFVILAVCAALVLVVISLRRPADVPLLVAAALVVVALAVVAILPQNVPTLFGVVLAIPAIALAVLGGDPVSRRILQIATRGQVREGDAGGIFVFDSRRGEGTEEVLRGGLTIGYLERTGTVLALLAGFPEALAVIVALKGIGRFSELATPAARERFIVGTMASLLWACAVGAIVRLAIW